MNPTQLAIFKKNEQYLNQKYNLLTISKILPSSGHGFMCECLCDCGKTTVKRLTDVRVGRFISCGCHHRNRPNVTGFQNKAFTGIGDMRGVHFDKIRRCALKRGISFNLTKEYLWQLFESQNAKCALSGQPIKFGRVHFRHETTASLDRIDSSIGYQPGNVQWVSKEINLIKNKLHNDYFIKLCSMVHNHTHKPEC